MVAQTAVLNLSVCGKDVEISMYELNVDERAKGHQLTVLSTDQRKQDASRRRPAQANRGSLPFTKCGKTHINKIQTNENQKGPNNKVQTGKEGTMCSHSTLQTQVPPKFADPTLHT